MADTADSGRLGCPEQRDEAERTDNRETGDGGEENLMVRTAPQRAMLRWDSTVGSQDGEDGATVAERILESARRIIRRWSTTGRLVIRMVSWGRSGRPARVSDEDALPRVAQETMMQLIEDDLGTAAAPGPPSSYEGDNSRGWWSNRKGSTKGRILTGAMTSRQTTDDLYGGCRESESSGWPLAVARENSLECIPQSPIGVCPQSRWDSSGFSDRDDVDKDLSQLWQPWFFGKDGHGASASDFRQTV